jgi:hypothetical protein
MAELYRRAPTPVHEIRGRAAAKMNDEKNPGGTGDFD